MTDDTPIQVSLLTGFLGSGKTTLLNALLKHEGMAETAVLINEFGDIGIDHELVETVDPEMIQLTTGCLCCSVQGDLTRALREIFLKRVNKQTPPFQRVLIESTGLADPAPVIQTLVNDPVIAHRYSLDGIITTIDAIHAPGQIHRHEECKRQAAVADRIVITKTDIATPAQIQNCQDVLSLLNPAAPKFFAISGKIDPNKLFDCALFDPQTKTYDVQNWLKAEAYNNQKPHNHHDHDKNRHDENVRAWCMEYKDPISWPAFIAWIQTLIDNYGEKILRIKGIVNIKGESQPVAIHGVQHIFHPPAKLPDWPGEDKSTKMVFIVDGLSQDVIEEQLNRLQEQDSRLS
jgi:G3E family GTPase